MDDKHRQVLMQVLGDFVGDEWEESKHPRGEGGKFKSKNEGWTTSSVNELMDEWDKTDNAKWDRKINELNDGWIVKGARQEDLKFDSAKEAIKQIRKNEVNGGYKVKSVTKDEDGTIFVKCNWSEGNGNREFVGEVTKHEKYSGKKHYTIEFVDNNVEEEWKRFKQQHFRDE